MQAVPGVAGWLWRAKEVVRLEGRAVEGLARRMKRRSGRVVRMGGRGRGIAGRSFIGDAFGV